MTSQRATAAHRLYLLRAPTILLLHGFPTSSHQYRNLIPHLSQHYRVVAPDLPGFGFTTVPAERNYSYTFAELATTIGAFLDALHIRSFAVYIFDYGAPVLLRLALQRPEAITAIVSQNGNAYTEGLGAAWAPIQKYLGRPGNFDIQLDLFKDYQTNVALYPKFQEYFRKSQVPLLAVWGKNDAFFVPPGAEAFKRDLPKAEVCLLDAGHFAGETETAEIAALMLKFLKGVFNHKKQ
ncbi:putative hydrolase [Mycena olivaceomarginata]|nr:putative hydrolase [Mycena olivaceomarginata]